MMPRFSLAGSCRQAQQQREWSRTVSARGMSPQEKSTSYIDEWFASIVKSNDFYEHHGNQDKRIYFYNIDLQGRLFLEDTLPKNIATSIKDVKFLDFFYRHITRLSAQDEEFIQKRNIPADYPFISRCGPELNLIRPAATPLVFHALEAQQLVYGGSLQHAFHPRHLAISSHTGRLYHQCASLQPRKEAGRHFVVPTTEYGLIRSSVAVTLSQHIIPVDDEPGNDSSGMEFRDQADFTSIPTLPLDAEPGDYALPADIDEG